MNKVFIAIKALDGGFVVENKAFETGQSAYDQIKIWMAESLLDTLKSTIPCDEKIAYFSRVVEEFSTYENSKFKIGNITYSIEEIKICEKGEYT